MFLCVALAGCVPACVRGRRRRTQLARSRRLPAGIAAGTPEPAWLPRWPAAPLRAWRRLWTPPTATLQRGCAHAGRTRQILYGQKSRPRRLSLGGPTDASPRALRACRSVLRRTVLGCALRGCWPRNPLRACLVPLVWYHLFVRAPAHAFWYERPLTEPQLTRRCNASRLHLAPPAGQLAPAEAARACAGQLA
jgi:hypothetical protein